MFTSQQAAAECSVLGEASSSESANATSTDKVSSVLYDPAEVATSDGPCRSGSTSWYQDGEMPPSKESYLEVPEVQDEEVETLLVISVTCLMTCERIQSKDPQFNSGIRTFCFRYNGMLSITYPTLSLASAFTASTGLQLAINV